MKQQLLDGLHDPEQLERLYRSNKSAFKREFLALYPEISERPIAAFWKARLDSSGPGITWGHTNDLTFVVIAALVAGTIAKAPAFLPVDEDYFYPRNMGFIVFPMLTVLFAWKNALRPPAIIAAAIAMSCAFLLINALPSGISGRADSDTLVLACIHLPLFLWAITGFAFVGGSRKDLEGRIEFLRFNGDLVVMTTLILIAGALMTGMTIALFSLINVSIERFYLEYVVVYGLAASPIVGTYVVRSNPQLVNSVSPVIAKIFAPLVLLTLVLYLIAMLGSGKDPYNDREFLLTFNLLLIGVMAIILFSIAGTARAASGRFGTWTLLLLAILTIAVNSIALLAILFRISEWGFTPNRIAVLVGNILILTNLLLVTYRLTQAAGKGTGLDQAEHTIARFLPVYSAWTAVVVFVFPFVFGFK